MYRVRSIRLNVGNINRNLIYMYNRDKSILYYFTNNQKKFLQDLKIHPSTFGKHLAKGTYYLGRYLFTRNFEPTARLKLMTLQDLILKLEKDRKVK